MRTDIRIEFPNTNELKDLIDKAYFKEGDHGKLLNKNNFIEIDINKDDILHTILKDLNNVTIKIANSDIFEGTCRFIIDNLLDNPRIYPISMYCIIDNNKYNFY